MANDRIQAIGLLTQANLNLLGPTFTRVWPVEEAPHFQELLKAVDRADRERHLSADGLTVEDRRP